MTSCKSNRARPVLTQQTGFDATLGYGGHTRAMLEQLQGKGHLHATDVDPIESEKTQKRLLDAGYGDDILTIHHMNFAGIDKIAAESGPFDFILADLGISSMQLDNPARGPGRFGHFLHAAG